MNNDNNIYDDNDIQWIVVPIEIMAKAVNSISEKVEELWSKLCAFARPLLPDSPNTHLDSLPSPPDSSPSPDSLAEDSSGFKALWISS